MYINIKKYYPVEFLTNSVLNAAGQVGQPNMLKSLMKVFDENNIITNYHCEDILDIIYIVIQRYGICEEFFIKKYIQIWEEICYNENNRSAQTKGLRLVKFIYQQNSKVFANSLSNGKKKDQLIEYIQQLIMSGDAEQTPTQTNEQQPMNGDMNPNLNTQNINVAEINQMENLFQPVNY